MFVVALVMTGACASGLRGPVSFSPRDCAAGLTGSFIQLSQRELDLDGDAWRDDMSLLRSVGVRTLIVQFTGDERGSFDRLTPQKPPVRLLLESAAATGLTVWLGLHADRRWPNQLMTDTELPPPLGDPGAAAELAALCTGSSSCEGFYLSPELDDHGGLADAPRVAAFVERATQVLRRLAPEKRISMAPFFSGALSPLDHAAFWRPVIASGMIDVFMLQDGVGTGRATPGMARRYLESLRRVMPPPVPGPQRGTELWSVVELFHQLAGPPWDRLPFAAEPGTFDVVGRSLADEGTVANRLVGFAVLDYMDPRRTAESRRLYGRYQRWCESPAAVRVSPFATRT